ncbi:NFACT RNA binding domain-containing protein [Dolosigranulum savutiense]|uniref:Rqc2 homolog RqcH n=1 Tax=Dolosigranulum savutiense TaxID=3110288 RepID=A0AB74TSV5_9LACT
MSFDGLFTHAIINELNHELVGGRITKIYQPFDNEIILRIRANRKNHDILISAHPQYARIQKTQRSFDNPQHPPHYCMILRKYLENGFLTEMKQVGNDRIIHLSVSGRNELGDEQSTTLVIEIMGRHSNIILVNNDENRIIDSIKHLPPSQNSYRTILPGSDFIPAPAQDKLNPFTADLTELDFPVTQTVKATTKWIQGTFQGFGRQSARELAERLREVPEKDYVTVTTEFFKQFDQRPYTPTLYPKGTPTFSAFNYISEEGPAQTFESLSALLDKYYDKKVTQDHIRQKSQDITSLVNNELKKNANKLEKMREELAETERAEDYQVKGEVLTAFMHEVQPGQESITLQNFYHDNEPIDIALDPEKTPAQNAQEYFKHYQKLKKRKKHLTSQIELTKQEVTYLESVLTGLDMVTLADIEEIRDELRDEGYLKQKKNSHQKKKQSKASKPYHFRSSDGADIYVGRNNRQNDQLTHRTANHEDWWLHAQNIPGSHVIIRGSNPSEQTLEEAAHLAAYFSKYRESANVPVDAVQVKYVNKPTGGKPGFVTYEGQTTYFVTPSENYIELLEQL